MPATNFQEAVDLAQVLVNQYELFVKGDQTTSIVTDGGLVPSLAKFIHDKDSEINAAGNSILQLSNNAKVAAQAAAASANAAWDSFRGIYYGALTADPSIDPLGNPISEGDNYFNTTVKALRFWNGTAWYTPNQSANDAQATADAAAIAAAAAQVTANAAMPKAGGTLTGAINQANPVSLASAPTVNIGGAQSNTIVITGTANITAFDTIAAGAQRRLRFAGSVKIIHYATGANEIALPSGIDFTTLAEDELQFESLGGGKWKCIGVHRQSVAEPTPPQVRQTVTDASVGANGMPNYLTAGTGLNVTVAASVVPVELTAANGRRNRNATITTNQTVPVAANSTNYIYADIAADGTASLGSTTVAPIYQFGGSQSTANGAFTFNTSRMIQSVGNGAQAVSSWRVFLGEVVTGAASVTSALAYALRGFFDSGLFLVAANTAYATTTNIGIAGSKVDVTIADDVNGTNERAAVIGDIALGSGTYAGSRPGVQSKNSVTMNTASNGVSVSTVLALGAITTGYMRLVVRRAW